MQPETPEENSDVKRMRKRQTTLADGRYLVFYTFDEETPPDDARTRAEASRREPEAENVAEEERRV